MYALHYLDDRPVVQQILIKHGADVNHVNAAEQTPLHLAASDGKLEIVKVHSSDCPLSSSSPCLLQLLLEEDANVNVVDKHGDTPLHAAAECGHPKTAKASQRYHIKI